MGFQIRKHHKRLNQIFILCYPLISNLPFSFWWSLSPYRRSPVPLLPRSPVSSARSFRCNLCVDTERREKEKWWYLKNDTKLFAVLLELLMMPIFQCLQANMCERWFVCARVGDYIYVYTYCMPRMSIIIFARNIESILFVYLSDLNRVDKKNTISMTINDFPKVQLCCSLQLCTC